MGPQNKLHVITGTRLATVNQVIKNEEGLMDLYRKMKLPESLAGKDFRKNREILDQCHDLGRKLSKSG
jgi:hypothetical protein